MATTKLHLPQLIRTHPFPPVQIPERMTWTGSSLRLFRKCKRKWFWKYIMRLRSQYRDKNLMIGSAFHECVARFYRSPRADMMSIARNYVTLLEREAEKHAASYDQEDYDRLQVMIDNFLGMMVGYSQMYADDKKLWRIDRASIESQFKVDYGKFDFAGKCDLIASRRSGKATKLFAVEHKTASKLRSSYIDRLPVDSQIRGYITGVTKGKGTPINEVLYDVVVKCRLRKKANESWEERSERVTNEYLADPGRYFYREPIPFAKSDVDSFEHELFQTHTEYLQLIRTREWADPEWLAGVGLMDDHLAENLKKFKELKDPLNPWSWATDDSVCDEYFRTCEYLPLCTQGLDMGTAKMYEQGELLNEELADED
jgi:hypothetical protein